MLIQTKNIIIHWQQGGWKTAFAVLLCCDYMFKNNSITRLYWNVEIKRDDVIISYPLSSVSDFTKFSFSKIPWVCLFDEMGLNFNSKKGGSDKNTALTDFFFLIRKYNLSWIYCSQRYGSIPVDMRELATYIFEIRAIQRLDDWPLFEITRQIDLWEAGLQTEEVFIEDIIWKLQFYWISYNTLESSIIT